MLNGKLKRLNVITKLLTTEQMTRRTDIQRLTVKAEEVSHQKG